MSRFKMYHSYRQTARRPTLATMDSRIINGFDNNHNVIEDMYNSRKRARLTPATDDPVRQLSEELDNPSKRARLSPSDDVRTVKEVKDLTLFLQLTRKCFLT